ncbi:MAG: YraN family protein [Acidobacteria bacterium]|nr:MAG: YraN family protein [Acidobacteriota bacterium]
MGLHRDRRRRVARGGETVAALFLRLKGYRIEARNWRCPLGEIDIVAWDGTTLVFVEVKTRTGTGAGSPEDAVTPEKQRRMVRLARVYLSHRGDAAPPCRFDVIAVEGRGWIPRLRHLRAAFRADGTT